MSSSPVNSGDQAGPPPVSDVNMAAPPPPCPYLALEIWTAIMEAVLAPTPNKGDSCCWAAIWVNCRQVSHALKMATERAFETQLHRIALYGPSPAYHEWYYKGFGRCCRLKHVFQRFSADRTRITLAIERIEPRYQIEYLLSDLSRTAHPTDQETAYPTDEEVAQMQRLYRLPMDYYISTDRAELSNSEREITSDLSPELAHRLKLSVTPRFYTVLQAGQGRQGIFRDAELPDLEFDPDALEISFEWKPWLNNLFAEEHFRKRLIAQHDSIAELKKRFVEQPPLTKVEPWEIYREINERTHRGEYELYVEAQVRFRRMKEWWQRHALEVSDLLKIDGRLYIEAYKGLEDAMSFMTERLMSYRPGQARTAIRRWRQWHPRLGRWRTALRFRRRMGDDP